MQDKDFLSYFDNLGHSPNDVSIKENTEKILTTLLTVEHQAAGKTEEYDSQLGQLVSEDLEYTVNRLVQGINSDILQNKKGFGTPLLGVLKSFKHIQPEKFIAYTDKVTDRSNAITKGERSHYLASRLFSLYCLILSGRIDNLPNSLDILTNVYNSLIPNMREGAWCGSMALRLIEASIENVDRKVGLKRLNILLKLFKSQLKSVATEFQLDNFGLLLYLSRKQFELNGDKQGALHDIIINLLTNGKSLTKVFQALMEVYPEKHICVRFLAEYLVRVRSQKEQESFWELVASLLKDKNTVVKDKTPWYHFYFDVLSLFKYWIKDPQLSGKTFVKVIESEIFKTWIKQLKVMNKFLKKVSLRIEEHLSKKILALLKEDGTMTPIDFLLKIKETKEYLFDTKNAMAKAILGSLNEEETLTYVNKLIEGFKQERESYQFYMSELLVIFELNGQQISDKGIMKICQFLIETYFTFEFEGEAVANEEEGITAEDAKKAIRDGVREEAFVKLNSIISRLLKQPSKAFEGRKNALWLGISANGEVWTFRVLKILLKVGNNCDLPYLETLKATIKCLEGLQVEVKEDLAHHEETKESKDSNNSGQEKTKKLIGLILMISSTALQLINTPDLEETVEELLEIAKRLKEKFAAEEEGNATHKKRKLDKKKQKKVETEEDKPVDVLIDVMVSLLTRCPGYLREAIERTFTQFVDEIDNFSLGNLIAVITRKDEEYFDEMGDDDPETQKRLEALKKFEEEEAQEAQDGEDAE